MKLPFRNNPSRYIFNGTAHHFFPKGKLYVSGPRNNPFDEEFGVYTDTWTARLFVGLSVKNKPVWTLEDVMDFTRKYLRKKGFPEDSSYIAQKGAFTHENKKVITEDSCQIIIINPGEDVKKFQSIIGELSEHLVKKLSQDSIILEFQHNGSVIGAFNIVSVEVADRLRKTSKIKRKFRSGGNVSDFL